MTPKPQTPSRCQECSKLLPAPKRTPRGATIGRKRLFCSDSCRKTAAQQKAAETSPTALRPVPDLPSDSTTHLDAALALIAAVELVRGDDFGAQDVSEAERFLSLARAADLDPANIATLRELRLSQGEFRRSIAPPPSDEQTTAFAELVASMSGGREVYQRTYAATLAAGATPELAHIAARAASGSPDPIAGDWHAQMAEFQGGEGGHDGR